MNQFDLTGRVAIVTGGNGGIGLGMATALARAGCSVAISGRNRKKNELACEQLSATGAPTGAWVVDVSERASVDDAFARTLAHFGRVDGCFANAGMAGEVKPFIDRTDDDWNEILATNLFGVVYYLQAAARHFITRAESGDAWGRLVATSSMATLYGTARNEHYAASKSAVDSVVRALAVELARYGVTANSILPGWTMTEMAEYALNHDRMKAALIPRIPARRYGEGRDFGISVYLMSEASNYHSGDRFTIDGGYSAF
jgi:NAD(P)-dependent dehydrogenase (short-subunit alcohol dehydrogenase family)